MALTAIGVALVWGALGAFGYASGWQLHARRAAHALVGAEQHLVRHASDMRHGRHEAACLVRASRGGQLAGLLEVPAIGLTAPVEEGATDGVLAAAVGHDPSSVWPGVDGTSAFLAHDVSYFVHLGTLKRGDVVVYRTACSTTRFVVSRVQVVKQGTPLPDTATPSLVLDTCYPSNALFFTTRRLLVWTNEEQRVPADGRHGAAIRVPSLDGLSYRVPAPAALVAQGLTLQQNEAPMGTMTLEGATSPRWAQSPGPLALESAALEAYFGGLHASAEGQSSWWRAIADPGVEMPGPLIGATATEVSAPLDVDIVSSHGVPVEVVLSTVVTTHGGKAPGSYRETVTTAVRDGEVTLSGWSLVATVT